MADLPDYYTQTAISEAEAASFKGGLDANKSAAPVSRQIYYATDSKILYVCVVDGTWINISALYLLLAGGTMTGNIAMGTKKLTGLGAPTAQNNSLRYGQAEIRNNEIAAAAAIAYSKLNLTGLIRNADIKSDAAIAYSKLNLALGIVNADIAAGAAIIVSKLVNTYFPETLMTNQGDLLIRGASNPERLAKITTGQFLKATATGYEGEALTIPGISSGTYTGNDTADRAIPHGLGVVPKIVIITQVLTWFHTIDDVAVIYYQRQQFAGGNVIEASTTTNFYVGKAAAGYTNSANADGLTYYWVASGV